MRIEDHWKRIKENLELINEGIEKSIAERQQSIAYSASAASADLLEILLHKNSLIDPGFIIKHEWLKSKNKIIEKIPFDFPKKVEILELIFKIEEKRNLLCYGKPQKREVVQEVINNFNKLKEVFKEAGLSELDKL